MRTAVKYCAVSSEARHWYEVSRSRMTFHEAGTTSWRKTMSGLWASTRSQTVFVRASKFFWSSPSMFHVSSLMFSGALVVISASSGFGSDPLGPS